ncbi:MAG: outer membrane beta-barrel protein [Verrucomicrobiae bacterium]|nr:outer membrane beta-barrel protein [Verrucomicrobiae bacterium]
MNRPSHLNSLAAAALFAVGITPAFAGSGAKEIAVVPTPAPEVECLSYDFIDLQYIYTSFDSMADGHGAGVNFSKGIAGNVYFTGSADWSSSSIDHADVDLYGATAGLGYAIPVSKRFHLNIEAGGIYSQFDGPYGYDDEEWGGYVGPGFRYCLSPGMELFANVYYVLFEGGEDLFETNVGIVANITETVAFKVAGLLSEDDQSVMAGLRFYY